MPLVPLLPDEPFAPLVPEEPEVPEVPDEPLVPDVPLVPDEPAVPFVPANATKFQKEVCVAGFSFTLPIPFIEIYDEPLYSTISLTA